MELRTLKYLLSLSEHGSFTAAAQSHYVTQPAVSIQLRKLQEELGTILYEMEGRTVRFTRAGEIVLEYARRFSGLEGKLLREIKDLEGLQKGNIALGTIDAASIYVLPSIFSSFHELYPGIDINLEIASTVPMLSRLSEGALDLVIGTLPVDEESGFEVFPIYKEPLVIIAPPEHPLTRKKRLPPRSLSGHPFISFHKGSITRRIIEEVLLAGGIRPRIAMGIDSPEAIKNLVASGLGLAVLPARTVQDEIERGILSVVSVRGLKFERKLGLILPAGRYLSTTVKAFLGVLEHGLKIKLPRSLRIPARTAAGNS